jgi:hypothetical protein
MAIVNSAVLILTLLSALTLLYIYVWRTMRQDIPLPPGVTEDNPQINVELLQQINAHRLERARRGTAPFTAFGERYFR